MSKLDQLIKNNQLWTEQMLAKSPDFFEKLSAQQTPDYLWIGCSDSRVPANEIIGLLPGEVFVHRNVANIVSHSDLNCLSVVQYAVDILKIKHIMITGHYGCGGVIAAFNDSRNGLVDNWLCHVKDVKHKHHHQIKQLDNEKAQVDLLCELNVKQQVLNLASTTIVQDAWARNQELSIHGLIYGLNDGKINDLDYCVESLQDLKRLES